MSNWWDQYPYAAPRLPHPWEPNAPTGLAALHAPRDTEYAPYQPQPVGLAALSPSASPSAMNPPGPGSLDALRQATAHIPPVRLPDPPAAQKPPAEQPGLLSDVGNLLKSGYASTAQGLNWLAGKVPGLNQVIDAEGGQQYWGDVANQAHANLSQAQQVAGQKKFFNDDNSLGPSWSDPRAYLGIAVESIPGTVIGMGMGGPITGALQKAGLAALPRLGAVGAERLAMGAGALGYGAGEGLTAAGSNAVQAKETVLQMPHEELQKVSPQYRELLQSLSPDQARAKLAEDTANQVGLQTGLTVAATGAPMGAAFGKLFHGSGQLGKTLLGSLGVGVAGEAGQELVQSGAEQFLQNKAIQENVNPQQSLWQGVLNQAVSGALAGGIMGGAMAAGGHGSTTANTQRNAEQAADNAIKQADQARDHLLNADDQVLAHSLATLNALPQDQLSADHQARVGDVTNAIQSEIERRIQRGAPTETGHPGLEGSFDPSIGLSNAPQATDAPATDLQQLDDLQRLHGSQSQSAQPAALQDSPVSQDLASSPPEAARAVQRNALASEVQQLNQPQSPALPSPTAMESQQAPLSGTKQKQGIAAEAGALNQAPTKPSDSIQLQRGQSIELSPLLGQASTKPSVSAQEQARLAEKMGARPQQKTSPASEVAPVSRTQTSTNPLAPMPAASAPKPQPEIQNDQRHQEGQAQTPPLLNRQHALSNLRTEEVPVDRLRLSEEVPQFKSGADAKGVVEPLGGKYDRTGTAPIIVWQRTDGRQEVISGRHRLDLARRSGESTIPAQVLREQDGFTADQAAMLDAELNIRDEQGKVKDYVHYFQGNRISQDEAQSRGLLARATGARAYGIAQGGTESLLAAHRADQLSDDAAYRISSAAPGNERLQAVGIKAIAEGKSTSNAVNFMQAVGSLAAERGATADTTGDLFGFDDSALKEAERMATLASRQQRRLTERLAAIQGAAKRPEMARQEGINVNDPAAVRAKIAEIKQQRDAWENWSTNPNLVAQIREEMTAPTKPARVTPADTVVKAPLLSSYSQADLQAEQTRLKQLEAEQASKGKKAAQKAEADKVAKHFVLTGSNRPSDIAMAAGQEGLRFSQPAQQPTDQEKLDHLLSSDPVVVPIRPALTDKHGKSLRDAADLLYRELQPATNQVDGKTVRFVRKAFKEMRQHSADERVMHIVPSLRTLFEKATPLWIDEDDGTHGRVKAWHNYGVRAAIDGKDTIVRLVARELDDGTLELLHYDADVRDPTEIENAMTGFAERSQQPKPGGQQNISSRKDRLIQWLENSYQGQPKLSRADSPTANTLTPTQARAQLVEALGEKAVKALQQAGRLEIHQNDPTKTGAAGFVDRNGVIHLVASNLENGDALSVALHEAMHIAVDDRFHEGNRAHIRLAHAALKLFGLKNFIGNPSFTTLVQDAYRLAAQGDKTAQQALAKAQQEYEANHHTDVQQELVSYLVQYADEKLPLVRRILSAIRAALFRMGIKVKLTPSDIRALAVSALKSQAKAAGKAVARQERRAATAFSQSDNPAPLTPQQRFEWAAAGVKLLTGNSDAFQYQTSTKQDLTAIAKDLSVKHKLRVTEEPAQGKERVWVVTMPDGKHASITLAANGREVHINAVLLEQGFSHGGLLYQLVGQWAHNTGKVFIGDPLGITDAGKARRLEHLISLALKFNSTDFIQPHPYQNIPWRIGQHDYNLAQMLMRSSELLHNTIPDLKALRYDFGKRQFVNTDTGRTLGQADFAALAQSPGARAAQAGATTLKRNVLVHTLVQSAGRAGWRSILGELAQQGSAQRRLDPAIRRLFSHATTADAAAEQDRLWQEFQAIRAQFQAQQASTTAFARWFGEGFEGVTAKDGKPLTLYHGTPTAFYQFDADRAGHNSKHPTAGLGFFMTADKGAAYRYGGNVLELHARINNPYFLTDADLMAVDSVAQAAKLKRQLQDKGYDGAVVTGPGMSPYVIAFQSHQVKLTSNQNPTESADFRFSKSDRIQRTMKELLSGIEQMRDWHNWYERHDTVLARIFGQDAALFQDILSATSQAATVKSNVGLALKAYEQFHSGKPFIGYLGGVIANLNRIRENRALAGAKISEYAEANQGDDEAIAVDRHIAMLFFNAQKPNKAQIIAAKTRIRKLAQQAGLQPKQVQAALWAYNQVRLDKDPAKVESYDAILEARADEIAALRASFSEDPAREGGRLSARSTLTEDESAGNGAATPVIRYSRPGRPTEWANNLPPEVRAMAEKIGAEPKPLRERLTESKDTLATRLRQGMVDRFARLADLDRQRFGADFTDTHTALSAWVAAKMSKSPEGALEAAFLHGELTWDEGALNVKDTGKGLVRALEPVAQAGELNRFWQWIIANRAERLAQEGREHLFTSEEIKTGKALNQGQMANGQSRTALYQQTFNRYRTIQKSILDIAQQSGLFDAQQRAQWEHDFYLPFYRVVDDAGETRGPSAGGKLVRQKAFEKLKGGTEKLGDPLQNILKNWFHLIDASVKNRAATLALDTAAHLGVAQQVAEAMTDKTSVWAMRDGQKVHYNVSDPLTLEAISALTAAPMSGWAMKALAATKRALILGTTISPAFKARNLLRDSIAALAVSKLSPNAFGNIASGYQAAKEGSATQAALLAGGGIFRFGTLLEGDRDAAAKRIAGFKPDTVLDSKEKIRGVFNLMKHGLEKWNQFGDRLESANRAALYQQMREANKTHLQASLAARDLMDFAQSGGWGATRFLITAVPFLNARLQGLDVLYRKGFKPLGKSLAGKGSKAENQQATRFALAAAIVSLASVVLYLAFKDDEDFKQREQWDRDMYWWFKLPGVEQPFRIPKPFEIGALGTIAERMVEQLSDPEAGGKLFADRMGAMLTQTFAFDPTPQLFKPMLDIAANKDSFTQRPIETLDMERLSPERRKRANTSALSTGLSQAGLGKLGLSPVQIEHLARGYSKTEPF